MLWTWPTRRSGSLWGELDRLRRDVNDLLKPLSRGNQTANGEFPAVNIWTGEDNAILTAELPGISLEKLDITVKNNTVTMRGARDQEDVGEGRAVLRQERGAGSFVRSFSLPFQLDADKVSAQYQKGVLQLMLPRSEDDRPKKIAVNAG